MSKTLIGIVDDHQLVMDGIKNMLSDYPEFEVLFEAKTAGAAQVQIAKANPDVLLLDINLPDASGVDLCQTLMKQHKELRILALTMHNEVSFVKRMMKHGAKGYLLKNTSQEELVRAIRTVMKGTNYIAKEAQEKLIAASIGQSSASDIPKLTRREKEVLALILEELTTNEIAEKLFISKATVETHRLHLLSKLGAKNTAGLVKIAIQNGLAE